WPEEPAFYVPPEAGERFLGARERGSAASSRWDEALEAYAREFPAAAAELRRRMAGELPEGWEEAIPSFSESLPTRKAGGAVLQALGEAVPELVGGSADLNPSTLTELAGAGDFEAPERPRRLQGAAGGVWGYAGRNVHFGVREHAMGSIGVGMALHGGVIPFVSTFLVFADYMRPPLRLAALTGLRVIHVFTHDSIALGEDGPTHQPVEQIMNLRAVPNMTVIRPADANEAAAAWRAALRHRAGPVVLVFSRQKLRLLDRKKYAPAEELERGAYVLWQSKEGDPDLVMIATGSEVAPTLDAGALLAADGIGVRVVSMPCWELFEAQPREYRDRVLPPGIRAAGPRRAPST
ncbi:MAG TPA: transketolase C-terminal domain-containing protein, partial [bacterium]|nr:transketolase C-terminal domain-containing protein [bacterium]